MLKQISMADKNVKQTDRQTKQTIAPERVWEYNIIMSLEMHSDKTLMA